MENKKTTTRCPACGKGDIEVHVTGTQISFIDVMSSSSDFFALHTHDFQPADSPEEFRCDTCNHSWDYFDTLKEAVFSAEDWRETAHG
jgi:hypothetical protein